MRALIHPRSLFAAFLLFTPPLLQAQEEEVMNKLREALRNTTLQLRTAQTQADENRLAKEKLEVEKEELLKKMEVMIAESIADQNAAEKARADLRGMIAKKETQIVQLNQALARWKAGYEEAAKIAREKEAAREKLSIKSIELQRKVDEYARNNMEMFKIATEILVRYENFGLGTAITSREPFVGVTRVKLQNLVQDYGDALANQRIKTEAPKKP